MGWFGLRLAALTAALLLAGSPAPASTLRLLSHGAAGTIDPQVNYTAQYWQLFAFLYDGLLAFRKVPDAAGAAIVPDLAAALPDISADGLVYTFHLRPGIRFADGRAVRPEDVVASFRRIFAVRSPTQQTFYGAIEGADACIADPAGCILPGVAAAGDAITIRLSRPDPELPAKLALPHASILPADAPAQDAGTVPIPGTGPYRIERYDPTTAMRIVRNPFFQVWNDAAQPPGIVDAIEYAFGLEEESEITAIENGQADWTFDTPPADRLGELGRRFRDRVHLNDAYALWYVPLNVNLPPFDDPRVRRAFNMAVDRRAAVRLFGGGAMAVPSCQTLPPGLPGYADDCPFRFDPAEARRLVQQAGAAGQPVTLVTDDSAAQRALGLYLRDVLEDIGLPTTLRSLSANVQFTYIQNTANRVQASLTSWYADYPSASNFLLGAFGCAAFHPNSDSSPNISGFCDAAVDARVEDAVARHDVAALAAADRALTAQAPAVVLFSPRYIDVLSARVTGYSYHVAFRWLISQSGVR